MTERPALEEAWSEEERAAFERHVAEVRATSLMLLGACADKLVFVVLDAYIDGIFRLALTHGPEARRHAQMVTTTLAQKLTELVYQNAPSTNTPQ